jgi:hypothetical protein
MSSAGTAFVVSFLRKRMGIALGEGDLPAIA